MSICGTILFLLLLMVETILYCFSILQNVVWINEVRYVSIALCFLFGVCVMAVMKWSKGEDGKHFSRRKMFIVWGLFFTCIADYFLVLKGSDYEWGIGFFLLVQICYFMYIVCEEGRWKEAVCKRWKRIVGRIVAGSVLCFGMYRIVGNIALQELLAVFYAVFSFDNIWLCIGKRRKEWFFTLGLILLFCCDICVAFSNSCGFGVEAQIASWLVWVFYIPSQVSISLSIKKST